MPGYKKVSEQIYKRGNSFYYRYDLPRSNAKRRQKAEKFKSQKEAEKRRDEVKYQKSHDKFIEPSKLTLAEFLDEWLIIHRSSIGDSTFVRYEGIIRNHLKPGLGHHQLQKIKPMTIQLFLANKREAGRVDGKSGKLKNGSINYLVNVLSLVFKSAEENELINRNPMSKIKRLPIEDVEITPLTLQETHRFLETSKDSKFAALFKLAIATGLRRGELFGLTWKDINFEKETLSVNRALKVSKLGIKLGPPKSKTSKRTISVPLNALLALVSHKIKQDERKLELGSEYQDNDLIFPADNGKPFCPDNIDRYFQPVLKEAGLPNC